MNMGLHMYRPIFIYMYKILKCSNVSVSIAQSLPLTSENTNNLIRVLWMFWQKNAIIVQSTMKRQFCFYGIYKLSSREILCYEKNAQNSDERFYWI